MDWVSLLKKTDLADQECIAGALEQMGVNSYYRLQNLPGKFGRPLLCRQSTHLIVEKLNKAIKQSADIPGRSNVTPTAPRTSNYLGHPCKRARTWCA